MAYFNSNVSAELRNYLERAYPDLVYRDHVLLGSCTHKAQYGAAVQVPVKIGYSAGQGQSFSTAATNDNGTQRVNFLVTPNKAYAVEGVDNSQLIYTEGKEEAVIDILTDAIRSATNAAGDQAEIACFGGGYGVRGTISSNSGGGPYVLTLTVASDAYNFSNGMVLVSKATATTGALDTGTATVTNISEQAGTVTVTANGGWTPTNTHVIGLQGTMQASTSAVDFVGLAGWLPDVNNRPQASENFFGVDRSVDSVRLAGSYLDGRGKPILSSIQTLAGSIAQNSGANPDLVLMNPANFSKVQLDLDTKARYIKTGSDVDVFFEGVGVVGPKAKTMAIHAAPWCPADHVYVLDSSTWVIGSPDNQPIRPASPTGDPVELSTSDTTQVRMRASFFFYCTAPGYNGNILVNP